MLLANESILWRGIYMPGHEACRVYRSDAEWCLDGTAVFSHQSKVCRLSYSVACDLDWNTRRAVIAGWLGNDEVNLKLSVDINHCWELNGVTESAVDGCVDLDLNFSPSTNLLPIRRLSLETGQAAEVNAAWLRFPGFELQRLSQVYTRLSEFTYRYSSDGGRFVADLTVNEFGLVTSYPGIWEADPS